MCIFASHLQIKSGRVTKLWKARAAVQDCCNWYWAALIKGSDWKSDVSYTAALLISSLPYCCNGKGWAKGFTARSFHSPHCFYQHLWVGFSGEGAFECQDCTILSLASHELGSNFLGTKRYVAWSIWLNSRIKIWRLIISAEFSQLPMSKKGFTFGHLWSLKLEWTHTNVIGSIIILTKTLEI